MAPNTAWATGLVFCTSGLPKATRNSVASTVFGAGGRYTPNLSSHVTHVIVDGESSSDTEKLRQMRLDRQTWPQEVVDIAWLAECVREQRLVDTEGYLVLRSVQVSDMSQDVTAVDTAASQMSCNVGRTPLLSAQCAMHHHVPGPVEAQHSQTGESNSIPAVREDPQLNPHIVVPHSTTKPWTISMSQLPEDPFLFRPGDACNASSCDPVAPWRIALPTLTEDVGAVQIEGAPDAPPQPLLLQPASPELPASPVVSRQPIAWALSPALMPKQAPVLAQLSKQPLTLSTAGRSNGLQERLPVSGLCRAPQFQGNPRLLTSSKEAEPASISLRNLLAGQSQVQDQHNALLQAASVPLPRSQDTPMDSPEPLDQPLSYCKRNEPTAPVMTLAWQLQSTESDKGSQLGSPPMSAYNAGTISNTDQHDRRHCLREHASHIQSSLESHRQQIMHPRHQQQPRPPPQQHLGKNDIGALCHMLDVGAHESSCLPQNSGMLLTPLPSSEQQATGFLPVTTLLQQLQLASSHAEAAEHPISLQHQHEHAVHFLPPNQEQLVMGQEAGDSHAMEISRQVANPRLRPGWNIYDAAPATEQHGNALSAPQPLSMTLHGLDYNHNQGIETNQQGGHVMQQAATSSRLQHASPNVNHVLGEITNVKPHSPAVCYIMDKSSPAKQTLMSISRCSTGNLSGLPVATNQEAILVPPESVTGLSSDTKQTLSAPVRETRTQLPKTPSVAQSMHSTQPEQLGIAAQTTIGCLHECHIQANDTSPRSSASAARCQQRSNGFVRHTGATASQQKPLSPSNRQHASKLYGLDDQGKLEHRFRQVADKSLSGLGLQAAVLDILATQRTDNNSIHCVAECEEQTQIPGTGLSCKQFEHRPASPVEFNQQHPVSELKVPHSISHEHGILPASSHPGPTVHTARTQAEAATQTENYSYEIGNLLQHVAKSAYLDPDLAPDQASAAVQSWQVVAETAVGRELATFPRCQQPPADARTDTDVTPASLIVCEPSSAMKWWQCGHHVVSPQWIHDARQATASSGGLHLQFMSSDIAEHVRKQFTSLQSSTFDIGSEVVCLTTAENASKQNETSSFDTKNQPEQQNSRKAVRFVNELEQCESDVTAGQAECQPRAVGKPLSRIKERQRVLQDIKKQEAAKAAGLARNLKTGIKMCIAPLELLSDVDWTVTSQPQLAEFYSQDADSCHTYTDPSTEVVFKGPSMILLAPRDAAGLLGHDAVQLHGGSQGITAQAVLEAVHVHYAKPMTREDMVHIMTQSADFRRLLQEPFLRGHDVPLSILLKDRVGWEGLKRYGRDHTMPVYQLDLC